MKKARNTIPKPQLILQKESTKLKIGGMSCAACAGTIEKALRKQSGVVSARVNLATESATIEYDPVTTNTRKLIKTVEASGYSVDRRQEENAVTEAQKAKRRLTLAWIGTTPIIILMILKMVFSIEVPFYHHGELLLAAMVLAIPGFPTYRSAIKSILHGNTNMDVLIMMGTGASFITGILRMFHFPIENFAGVGAMIMAFHLGGRYIESSAKGKASQAIRKLLELGAKTARILKEGREIEIPVDEVSVSNIMIIKPGEKIPTDGEIIEGESAIDE